MATLTPGELLGVLKENNAQVLTQTSAIFSANSPPPRRTLNQAATGLPATKTWTTRGMKTTARKRPGRTCYPPGDVKHDGTAVGLRWQLGWPIPPLSHK